ncbi:DUF2794 domain-containing protein [Maricaulis maris]|uniref:Uncharacterized protein DUF2794 n=1 Tax=Maricaulis maris TaxID=74318 RepID=A0A495D5I2_9PROT|nr:DUF2794 domain-containing protein [Maricaulis maris]RKQ96679.1 uncharacterized protein DUF2794 [Maricaulis maris]
MQSLSPSAKRKPEPVMWTRRELDAILRVYGRFVAQGEWKDYAIDGLRTEAVFSIFRRHSEMPMYSVIKTPADANRQGQFKVVAMAGQILKRGHDLTQVMSVFDKKKFQVID